MLEGLANVACSAEESGLAAESEGRDGEWGVGQGAWRVVRWRRRAAGRLARSSGWCKGGSRRCETCKAAGGRG